MDGLDRTDSIHCRDSEFKVRFEGCSCCGGIQPRASPIAMVNTPSEMPVPAASSRGGVHGRLEVVAMDDDDTVGVVSSSFEEGLDRVWLIVNMPSFTQRTLRKLMMARQSSVVWRTLFRLKQSRWTCQRCKPITPHPRGIPQNGQGGCGEHFPEAVVMKTIPFSGCIGRSK